MRIINVPARGIGQTTVKRLLEEAIRRGKPLGDVLATLRRLRWACRRRPCNRSQGSRR